MEQERDQTRLLAMYHTMVLARSLDERMWQLNRQGKAPFVISCQGHEAAQVGAAFAMRPKHDWIVPYYRDLAMMLAMGMTPREVMLGLLAKAEDPSSGGRQMPAHYSHRALNIVSHSSPTGTQVPHAVGVAMGAQMRGDDIVVWTAFGEGTSSQGDVHEAMNLAGVMKLPVIFFCENNGYAISVPQHKQMGVENVSDRGPGYGFPGITVDGTNVLEVYEAMTAAVERARRGDGPTLIEAKCVRLTAHSSDDNDRTYRSPEDIKAMRTRDPIASFEHFLRDEGMLDDAKVAAIRAEIKEIVNDATAYAEAAPLPDPSTVRKYVFAE
ncbi:MAG TPA: thiamine pyrophosphate-dependent dehydrogenase E1 component subunit alpha [Herpetosiphon sp.]|uniref:2-oxoisovalerate dehydrogenase subunit alpha n=2 Tax=Herpetosiphon TaxID=64 RepID=A9B0C0_HERA2|nr:thiamine pyrophosphate-dependent dehydrogenase E1 component subunit alpha [Herpetosiphon sp.]ABX05229.1 3-methyl-2-oxobutanoate dehydrogenase (2-methylpropanoyl-transferring) [Herpetosiphon aurantiacus DSM 785]MCA0351314.1 thiamine pyrophosphate-dependent dehydrogenase E1 component subunit alpha [Chloroflexota bacterium]HBW51261.1 thiamine pyrophosphate-dependent dehydrogenase E1 component subunit alpha [Herpetosiphon sp.]